MTVDLHDQHPRLAHWLSLLVGMLLALRRQITGRAISEWQL